MKKIGVNILLNICNVTYLLYMDHGVKPVQFSSFELMQCGVIEALYLLLRFDHHSAGRKFFTAGIKCPPRVIGRWSREIDEVTSVVPPTAAIRHRTIFAWVVVVVVRREHHPIVIIDATLFGRMHGVPAVSAEAGHVDAILVVRLVTNRERPVLG